MDMNENFSPYEINEEENQQIAYDEPTDQYEQPTDNQDHQNIYNENQNVDINYEHFDGQDNLEEVKEEENINQPSEQMDEEYY
jgi:hypothetical protein